ncbi:ATP-binding protein [Schlegelella sp. S2-27]|uniref:histidine kinase n=1 Tax=Caldimonas mangrovi TaxID=2944811 RepID=A0ABT0YMN6_9BURK|nr:ATP-binding protein [Caldimonas mangrovi]MCM5679990.1 ATP-binding protein [Caldimonas mangrovi]
MTPLRAWAIDRVRTRLLAAFLILLVAAIALAAVGWFGMRGAQRAVAGFEDDLLPNISHSLELAERTTQLAAVAPKLADSATEEAFNENTSAVLDLLEQIRQQSTGMEPSTEFGAALTRLQDEVRRDLNFLIVLTREKLELQRRFAQRLVQLDRLGTELNGRGRGLVILDPSIATAWSSMVMGIAVDDPALLGRLEADVEASLLSAQRRRALAPYGAEFGTLLDELSTGPDSVLGLRRSIFDVERHASYLVVLTRANANELSDEVARHVGKLRANAAMRSDAIGRAARFGETGMIALALVCLAIAGGAAHYVRRLVAEIENITNVMSRLAQGDTKQSTPATRRRDELGALARTFEVFRDALVAKQQLVTDLRTQREMVEAVHNSMTDALAVFDSDQRLMLWNPQFTQLLARYEIHPRCGFTAEQLLAQLPAGSTWLAPGHTAPNRLTTARPGDFSAFDHIELRLPDGQVFDLRTRAMPGSGAVTLVTDLTARRAIESQLQHAQKLEVLGQLTGGVAHDFNNYLGTILGNLSLVEAELSAQSTAQAQLARVQRAAHSAAGLTRRLLAFARRQPLQAEHVAVDEMVEEMGDLIEYSAGSQVTVAFELDAPGAYVFVDRGQLENSLLNLVLNSAAAMPAGGRLTVATARADGHVEVQVRDTGTGIPEHLQGKVFEPFFSTKAAGVGSGLGLSIVYGFVKQSGGDISLASAQGVGTAVRLSFPCSTAPAPQAVSAARALPVPRPLTGLEVLVVDDDEAFRATVTDMLEKAGAHPRPVASAEDALAAMAQGCEPTLVLSDICLGAGMDGLRLRREVATRWPGRPVALMSGLSPEMLQERTAWDPAAAFLQKPFELPALEVWLAGVMADAAEGVTET